MSLARIAAGALIAVSACAAVVTAESAPDFVLKDLNGATVQLSQLKGKVVFLDFWASWCPPCRQSIPIVEKLHEKMKGQSVIFLGINIEGDANAARKFAASKGMQYPVLIGDEKVARDYRVTGIPAFFIIDQNGAVVRQYTGYRPGTEAEWENEITNLIKSKPAQPSPRSPARSKQPTK